MEIKNRISLPKISLKGLLIHLVLLFGLLAHLNQRLIGELIIYQQFGVHLSSVRPSSTMLKHLLLRNLLANQSQILCRAFFVGGTKVCSQHLGHMAKMATMPIYGKNSSQNLLQNRWTDFHEPWYVASGTPVHQSLFK